MCSKPEISHHGASQEKQAFLHERELARGFAKIETAADRVHFEHLSNELY
jgi:hypothetical protein